MAEINPLDVSRGPLPTVDRNIMYRMPVGQVLALCEYVMDPFVPSCHVHLRGSGGLGHQVTVTIDDVVLLRHDDGHLTMSRLGIINALLEQVAPGLRLVAYVPDDSDDSSPDNIYGLSLQVFP